MNQQELFEYLNLQRDLFKMKTIEIISSDFKFFHIDISNFIWINRGFWSNTICSIEDLSIIEFPVTIHLKRFPPYECIMELYLFGKIENQTIPIWFFYKYLKDQSEMPGELYHEKDLDRGYQMIYDEFYKV